jgi:hypothetical protein
MCSTGRELVLLPLDGVVLLTLSVGSYEVCGSRGPVSQCGRMKCGSSRRHEPYVILHRVVDIHPIWCTSPVLFTLDYNCSRVITFKQAEGINVIQSLKVHLYSL